MSPVRNSDHFTDDAISSGCAVAEEKIGATDGIGGDGVEAAGWWQGSSAGVVSP